VIRFVVTIVQMKPLVLALSGGGGHAAAHAGVVRVFEREGIPIAGLAGVLGCPVSFPVNTGAGFVVTLTALALLSVARRS